MKVHRGRLHSHPQEAREPQTPPVELIHSDPLTYLTHVDVPGEVLHEGESEAAAKLARERCLEAMRRFADTPAEGTWRAWAVRHPDRPVWRVRVQVSGTRPAPFRGGKA